MRFTTCVGFILLLVPARGAWCQEVFGSLQGRIVNRDRQPLGSVQVIASGPSLPGERAAVTRSDGHFSLLGLPVGTYRVRIAGIGYRAVVYEGVTVQLGRTADLGETQLEPQTVDLPELVVTGRPAILDPTTTTVGLNLSAATFEALPTERDYRSIIALLPQANASYYGDAVNIGGSSGSENIYYIDGVNVTDPHSAAAGTSLPYNFVREIQVKEGGYEAEFGKSLGGIINVVTHSAGDRFNAQMFGFVTNHRLADDYRPGLLDAQVTAFSTYDFGLSLSGPVVRQRLSFFAAYNPSFERQDIEIPTLGVFPDRRVAHLFAGKLMWRVAPATNVVLSVFGDPTNHHRVGPWRVTPGTPASLANPDPFLGFIELGGTNASLNGRTSPVPWLVLEGSVARYDRADREAPDTETGSREPRYADNRPGINSVSGGFGATVDDAHTTRTTAKLAATFFGGAHTVKAGAEYEENVLDHQLQTTSPGNVARNGLANYSVGAIARDSRARNRVPSFFLQDSWRATGSLTVNGGLRWDGQYLIGAGDSVAQAITDQFQPRVGFSFQPGRPNSQKLSGSFGRFYQQLPLHLSNLEHVVVEQCQYLYNVDPRLAGAQPLSKSCLYAAGAPRASKGDDVEGEHFDEFTLGYERLLTSDVKVALRGVRRVLRAAYVAGIDTVRLPDRASVFTGNPGSGQLSFLPEAQRDYSALELTIERIGSRRLSFLGSYVISRSHGNYTGLFASDVRRATPGWNFALMRAEQAVNSTGPLPNDRPHVLKLWGSYRLDFGLSAGTFFTWQSGTPLGETGPANVSPGGNLWPVFLVPRGSAGRTPAIWDANVRLTYEVHRAGLGSGRVIADLLHVGSPRTVADLDQRRFVGVQGNPNPTFGQPIRHQPPMQLRLGLEWRLRS